ncbi:MAG: hypothetical protein O7A07_06270 [Acidobacteria bacterium]|nr:hypothetical protein [Acidobacteriota bacterium]
MRHGSRFLVAAAAAALLPILALTVGHEGLQPLLRETSLRATPAGDLIAFLPAGSQVEVLERRDDWLQVRLVGWVPVDTLSGAAAATPTGQDEAAAPSRAPAQVNAPPPPAPAAAAATVIEGMVKARTGRRARPAAGLNLYLVPAAVGSDLMTGAAESNPDFVVLQQQVADLGRQAGRAMQEGSFMAATAEHDRLRQEQAKVKRQVADILTAHHGRHAMAAREQAIAGATTDARGWYTFTGVPPGDYMVYARLVRDDADVEWVLRTRVADGVARVDLDNTNARDQMKN